MAKVEQILEVAFAELGYVEEPVNKTKYGKAFGMNGAQWCGLFVMWVFRQAKHVCPNTAYTPNGVNAFKNAGMWHHKGEPIAGDVIYFDFPDDGLDRVSHVGIVVDTTKHGILTIEGNTTPTNGYGDERNGGQVSLKLRNPEHVVGWGRPNYSKQSNPESVVNAIKTTYQYLIAADEPVIPKKKTAKKKVKSNES